MPGCVAAVQDYVRRMEAERSLDGQDIMPQCLKLGEEVGDLFRAVLKWQGHPEDPEGRDADESADVLILLISIVNRCGISLEEAFRAKEAHAGQQSHRARWC